MAEFLNQLSAYDFVLPDRLIAKRPLANRSDSRLMVLGKNMAEPKHDQFRNLLQYLCPGDALVLNNTKVFPARLTGKKAETGGSVEILLSRPEPDGSWICLVAARRGAKPGTKILVQSSKIPLPPFPKGELIATVLCKLDDEPGAYRVRFDGDIMGFANQFGELPLPPYIDRQPDASDAERYQTVFAQSAEQRAVAAPTAGLHFDEDMLEKIKAMGVSIVYVTLHVGPGTFLPVRTENLDEHKMHGEIWSLSSEAAETLNQTRATGKRIVAVGTTSVRLLETASQAGEFCASSGLSKLFIRPGFRFRAVDAFVTNFHLPKTTLLMLVAAAIGRERMLAAYGEAMQEQYRFFSYGDACFFDVVDDAK